MNLINWNLTIFEIIQNDFMRILTECYTLFSNIWLQCEQARSSPPTLICFK